MVHSSYHDIDETDVFELVAAFQSAGRKKLIMQGLPSNGVSKERGLRQNKKMHEVFDL
jgi:hypothetical protein